MLLGLLVFLSVGFALAGICIWAAPSQAQRSLQRLAQPGAPWREQAARWAQPLARWSLPAGAWQDSPLRLQMLQAGIAREDARLIYFAAKSTLPLLLAGTALVLAPGKAGDALHLMWLMALAALVGSYLPNVFLRVARQRRQREIFEHFPDATDLLLVCMEAGLGLDAALTRVAQEIRLSSKALADELQLTLLELRAGQAREQALRHLALRSGVEEIATFALMLKQADRFGTSIGDSLRVYSDELRHKRMVRAEEVAARVPTKMLLPLVLCIFPSIIMVVMGPAAIQIVRTLMPMFGQGG
jgi:tight adherence protein C